MEWNRIREWYPSKWVVIEARSSHSHKGYRILDDMEVLEVFEEPMSAMQCHANLQKENPTRELYFFHTSRELLDIHERKRVRFQKV